MIELDNAGLIWSPLGVVAICALDGESFILVQVRGTSLVRIAGWCGATASADSGGPTGISRPCPAAGNPLNVSERRLLAAIRLWGVLATVLVGVPAWARASILTFREERPSGQAEYGLVRFLHA